MISINDAYDDYIQGATDWEAFLIVCYAFIADTVVRLFRVSMEDRGDTVAEFYPKLCRIVERYEDNGSTFEAYLTVCLRFFCRTRAQRIRSLYRHEVLMEDVDTVLITAETPPTDFCTEFTACTEPDVCTKASVCGPSFALITNTRKSDTLRRQLLICFCKNLPLLDQDQINTYTTLLCIPPLLVKSLEVYVSDRRQNFLNRRNKYTLQRNRHFAKMHTYQRLAQEELNPRSRKTLHERSEFHRTRWLYYRTRLQKQNVHLSNREVGVLLGIPKGSVDSAMSNLTRYLEKILRHR
ncbi:MAG: hypothetical protein WCY01_06820 [Alkalispirochaeta sp.]